MSLTPSSLSILDLSGGITDYILNAEVNQAATINNFDINPNKNLTQSAGSQIYSSTTYQIPPGVQRVCGIFPALQYPELFFNSARDIFVVASGAWQTLAGPTGNKPFSAGTVADFPSFAEWNQHIFGTSSSFPLPIKMYKADGDTTWRVRTAGLPQIAAPTVTSTGGAGQNFIYAFLYHYTYTVGSTVFEDFGPVTEVPLNNVGAPNTNTVNVTAIPVLANGVTGNWDTVTIRKYIYRTLNGGNVFYKVGDVANATTVFADTFSDATILANNLLLYTNAGVLDNDAPPPCKYVHVVNGIGYWGHVIVGGETLKNRVMQSDQDDPDSCPAGNYVELVDEVTGLSSYNDNPLVFTKNHVYRLNGQFSETGQGGITYEDITKTIGCVSNASIVQTRYGVFWAGNDGFYWTDGFNFSKVSDSLNETYKLLVESNTAAARIVGCFDSKDNKVRWAVRLDESSPDNDTLFSLDLRWGVKPASTFTTRSNGSDFSPASLAFYQNQLIHGDHRGYILRHDKDYINDPVIVTTVVPTSWATKSLQPYYKSTALNFGETQIRKWVTKILTTLNNQSNMSVQVAAINDNSSKVDLLTQIRFRGNFIWGDIAAIWGDPNLPWSFTNILAEMRRFPAGSLRCQYKQIIITQAFTNIYNSDTFGLATVNGPARTATLISGDDWMFDVMNYYITFETDDYTAEYFVTGFTGDVLNYLDPLLTAPTGDVKWLIRGFPKSEIIDVIGYCVYFAPLTDQTFKTWRTEQDSTGGNT